MSGGAKFGHIVTEATRNKIRAFWIGRKATDETKRKMSAARMGHTTSEETKRKIGLANSNKTEEQRRQISERMKGRFVSEETKRKIGNANKNNKPHLGKNHTEETKLIISQKRKLQIIGKRTYETKQKMCESNIGGFWYGNVKYYSYIVECELWKDVNPRVHAWFDYKCVLCEQPENGKSHIGHHVFYDTRACCLISKDGKYYTNLNARGHPEKDYYIGENPNYFVILCPECHGKTGGKFANRKKYADELREMIDTYYGGKCYYTKEEMDLIK